MLMLVVVLVLVCLRCCVLFLGCCAPKSVISRVFQVQLHVLNSEEISLAAGRWLKQIKALIDFGFGMIRFHGEASLGYT